MTITKKKKRKEKRRNQKLITNDKEKEKEKEKENIPQKNATQIGSRNRRSGVKVITKVDGGEEAQSNKIGKMKGEGSLKN